LKIAINQPTYLPWMGYFDLIDQVDLFVILDNVQFVKQSWQQRNRIKTANGLQWLTVPVIFRGRLGQLIKDVEIRDRQFARDHIRAIELAHSRSTFFAQYFPSLRERLEELNRQLQDQYAQLNRVAKALGFKPDTLVSQIPPKLDGVVTAVDEAKGLVEISLGSDDGLKRGHVLQVIRGNQYLGQITIRDIEHDRAVGAVDKKLQRGRIKKDDNVTTKLS